MEQSARADGVRIVDRLGRRWYTPAFRAEVVEQCGRPGVSVAAIALDRGLNANLVRKWIAKATVRPEPVRLVPVKVRPIGASGPSSAGPARSAIVIQLSGIEVTVAETASAEQIEAVIRSLR